MKRKSHSWIVFIPIAFCALGLHLSYAFPIQRPSFFCQDIPSSDSNSSIRKTIEKRVDSLGKENFATTYNSVHGLLNLAYELSNETDSIDRILEVVADVLGQEDFKSLDWSSSFGGSRDKLLALINGFFDESEKLRKENNKNVFILGRGKSFSILGKQGSDRFVQLVFSGDKDRAFLAALTVLTSDQLEEMKWYRAQHFKKYGFVEGIKKMDSDFGKLNRKLGEIVEGLATDKVLGDFFIERDIVSNLYLLRKQTREFDGSLLPEEQKAHYALNRYNQIEREIDVLILSNKNIVVVEIKGVLRNQDVDKLIQTLLRSP